MRPLSAQAKEYCKKGHNNECPFLKQFAAHCKDDKINMAADQPKTHFLVLFLSFGVISQHLEIG